jgi:hypothetical protein
MRAERKFKELQEAGEEIPEDIAKTLYDLGSDLAPGKTIWEDLAGSAPVAAGGVPANARAATGGAWAPPAGVAVGGKGEPNSFNKLRAKRMRAERAAKEALGRGEPIPADAIATINELGGTLPTEA